MIIKARENNVLRENFEVNRDEAVRFLSIELRDENDQIIKSQMKSTSKVILPDGGIFDENDDILSEDFESATIESYIVIAAGENLDKVDNVTLKPYYWKFIDNGKYEQEYLNSLEWHEIKDGEYTAKNTNGAELTINKVEVKNDRILFYYKTNNLVSNENIFVRNSSREFNFFYMDISEKETAPGEYVTGIRIKDYQGASTKNYENGDTDETANIEDYTDESYLSDVSKLVFAIDLGNQAMIENLGDGLTISLK